MKYFKKEYWLAWNSGNEEIIKKADMDWSNAIDAYIKYFNTIKAKLPKPLSTDYLTKWNFHDAMLPQIIIKNMGKERSDIAIFLNPIGPLHGKKYQLIYQNVIGLCINIPCDKSWPTGYMTWAYDEFELLDDGNLEHRILLDYDCSIKIVFKKISMKRIKEEGET